MKKLFPLILAAIALAVLIDPALAQTPVIRNEGGGGVINVGSAFGWAEPYVNTILGSLITSGIGWLMYLTHLDKTGLIDQQARDALETFLKNQASSLTADGFVRMSGLQIHVDSAALASAASTALTMIPGTIKHFGLTPEILAAKIVDKLPHVPAVAQAQAAAMTQGTPV